jgi:O-antigen/teichoic acid export membrane protein
MKRNEKLILVKNAAANVVRGSASAVVAVVTPLFLVRLMSVDSYGVWSLVLQLSAYVGYLDFGIQTAVGRFVAHSNEKSDEAQRDGIVSTSFAALTVIGAVVLLASFGVAFLFPHVFRHMPSALVGDAGVAFVLVASSLAIGLPASVFNGIFIGLQRYEVPAAIIGGSRIFSALLIILVVRSGGDLARMGLAVAAVNLASYALQYLLYKKMAPTVHFSARLVSWRAGRELFDYCFSLTVWSFAMLLVNGLDLSLVGYFQFEKLAYYAVAATAVTFLAGLQNAVFGVLIPSTAVLQARGDSKELGRVMVTATRYGVFLLLLTGLPLILTAKSILTLWVGPAYAISGERILQILVAANLIRLSAAPYVMTLIGTGQQRLVIVTPLMEGFSNLFASAVGGYLLGALGIAIGTFFGSLVGAGGILFYNMRRTVALEFRLTDYMRDGLFRPAICAVPAIALTVLLRQADLLSRTTAILACIATLMVTGFLVWRWGLVGTERERLLALRLVPQA